MPAASERNPDEPAAVAAFLTAAAELYQALASALQTEGDGASTPRVDFAVLSAQLGRATEALGPVADASLLADACRRVGLELCLKLGRLRDSGAVADGYVVDEAVLRGAWSSRDVEALGTRLQGLVNQFSDDAVSFKVVHVQHTGDSKAAPDIRQVGSADTHDRNAGEDGQVESTGEKAAPTGRVGLIIQTAAAVVKAARPRPAPASLLYEFILDGLAYKSMHDREDEVVQAHASTFEWVFADDAAASQDGRFKDRFTSWLAADDLGSTYWITGKPGSGKSTFMRFLFRHPLTARHLQRWAGGRPVQTAGFFFWTSGSREQRSQTGLLRSLLHQLLTDSRELIPSAFPDLWDKLRGMSTKDRIKLSLDWTAQELMDAFQRLMDAALPQMKLCLFVDGLDEFDGDHLSIINFFKNLGQGEHGHAIKMCLSSRPWAVFENAFERAVPHLRLQDLTYDDMYRYVRDRLVGDSRTQHLLQSDVEAGEKLVSNTVDRADGVFLWVRLAVNEMMGQLQTSPDASSLSSLSSALARLPTELDCLFSKLLFEDQTAAELGETAAIFQLICAREVVADFVRDDSANSLTVWELAFALEGANDDALAVEAVVEEATDEFIHGRCQRTVQRITQRFAGLLDMHSPPRQGNARVPRFQRSDDDPARDMDGRIVAAKRVTYIHRTVRDWLTAAEGIGERLAAASRPGFDPHLRLLRSYVLRLKRPLEAIEHHRRLDEWWPDIALAMTHARHVVVDDAEGLQRRLVNALDGALDWLWLRKGGLGGRDHWAWSAFGSYEVRMKAPPVRQPFLCLATKFGLTRYVCEELDFRSGRGGNNSTSEDVQGHDEEAEDDGSNEATPLLSYATEFLCSRNTTIFPLSDPELVRYLLSHPSRSNPGPNHAYRDFNTRKPTTPWLTLLRHLRNARRRGWIAYYDTDPAGTRRWARIVRSFVDVGGADARAVVLADSWDPEISAVGVLELLDGTYGAVEMCELRELLVRKSHSEATDGDSGVRGDSEVGQCSTAEDSSRAKKAAGFVLRLKNLDAQD